MTAGILGLVGLIVSTVYVVSLFVPDWTWVATWIYRALEVSAAVLLTACIAASPASFFRRARGAVAAFYLFSSCVFGLLLWAECTFFVLSIWGRIWLAGGLLAAVLGVIPLAFVACLSSRRWDGAVEIPIAICLIIAVRLVAFRLIQPPRRAGDLGHER